MTAPKLDKFTFGATFIALFGVCLPLLLAPEASNKVLSSLFGFMTKTFGITYLWAGIGAMIFLAWLAFSRHGKVKLGEHAPDFSTYSWATMLFCAGIASGILYWSVIEWNYYYNSPPLGLEARSTEAAEVAAMYGMFHWGITAWAFYTVPTVIIAYSYYVRGHHLLKISEVCRGVLGDLIDGPVGKIIDALFMFGLLGAAGTSLGLGTPLIASGVSHLTGMEESFGLKLLVLLACTLIFAGSVWSGLEKGIQFLSRLNTGLALGLLVFVLVVGPTAFILKMGTNAVGLMLENFIRMNTWTDPVAKGGFPEGWTIFYWAWWIVYAPFMGLFVAKISRGRTIRELIGGMLAYGTAGCVIFFAIFGNFAMDLELSGVFDVTKSLKENGGPATIIAVVAQLPLSGLAVLVFCVVALIYLATTFDSASYTLAAVTTDELDEDEHPARWNRLFWAFALALLPMGLMFAGGLKSVQTASVVSALPMIILMVIMVISFLRDLATDEKAAAGTPKQPVPDGLAATQPAE